MSLYKLIIEDLYKWIRSYVRDKNVIIGISGGKDSSVVAALCVNALGADKVIGVMLPNGTQKDIQDAEDIINHLGIRKIKMNIEKISNEFDNLILEVGEINGAYKTNTPARIRMTMLYGIAAVIGNSLVAATSNLSEKYIGWETKWGDNVGDFAPLANLTVTEIIEIGKLILPERFVIKPPEDGLTGKTDEENFGFKYEDVDNLIRNKKDKISSPESYKKILKMHILSSHKRNPIPSYKKWGEE